MGRTAPGAGSFGADPDGTDSDDSDCSAGNAEGRVCTICQNRKPLHEFYKDATKPLGHDRLCKVCKKARADARKQAAPVAIVQRQCSICKEVKASNDFIRDARRSTGLDARCKVCRRQQHQKRKLANIAAGGPSVLEKECKRCQQVKPATAFKRHAYTTTGLDSWCKDCCKQRRSEKSEQLRQGRCPPASPRPFLPPSSPSATTSTTPPPPSLLTPLPNTAAGHDAGSSSEGGAMGSAAAMAAETVSWGLAAAAKPAVASQATGRQAATQAEEPLAAMAGYPADPACILKAPGAAGELGPVLPARPGQGLSIQGLGQGVCGAQVGGWDANQGLGQGLGLSTAQAIVPMVGVCAATRRHLPPASCLVPPAPCPAPAAAPGPAQMAPGSTCLPDARCWTAAWPPLPQGRDAWQQQQERHTGWAVVTLGPGGQVVAQRGDGQQATQLQQTERQRKGWPGLAPGAQGDNTAVMPQAPATATTTDADMPRTQRTLTFAGWEAAMSAQPSNPSHGRSLATSDAIWSQAGAGRGGCTGSRPGVDMTLDMSFSLNLNLNAVTPRLGSPADATPAFPAPSKPLWPAESAQLIQACLQTWLQQPSGVEGSSLTPSLCLPPPPPPPQDAITAPVEGRAPPALQIHPLATGCPAAAEGGQPGANELPAMATPPALGTPSWLVEGPMGPAAGPAHQASTQHLGNSLPLAGHLGLPPAHPSPTSAPTHSPPSPAPSPQPQLASLPTLLATPGPTPLAGGTKQPAAPLAPGPASVEAAGAAPDPCEAPAGLPDLPPPPSSCPSLSWGSSLLGGEPHQLLCSGSMGALFGQQSAVLQPLGGLGAGLDKGSLGGVGVGGAGPGKEQGQGREVERVGGGAQEASGGARRERRGLEGGLPEQQQQQQQQAQQQGRQQQVRTHTSMSVFATAQRLMLSTDPPAADPAQGSGPDPSGNSGPAAAGQLPSSAWQALFSSFAAGAPTADPPATPAVAGARGGGGEAGGLPAPLLSGSQSQALGHKVSGSSSWLLHSSAFDSLMGTRLASGLLPGSLVLDSLAGMAGAGSPTAAAAGQAGQAPPLRPHSLSPISSLAAAAPLPVM